MRDSVRTRALDCPDDGSIDLKRPSEFKKLADSHAWELAHFDEFGKNGIIVRYSCIRCGKEWTTMLLESDANMC